MNEYTLQDLLRDLLAPYTENEHPTYLSAPRTHQEAVAQIGGEWRTFTPAHGLLPWDENGRDLDRFDVICGTLRQQAWWTPGHTREEHQLYTTLRGDRMSVAEALNAVEALEALEVRT